MSLFDKSKKKLIDKPNKNLIKSNEPIESTYSNEIDDSFDVADLFGSSHGNIKKETEKIDLSLNDDTKVDYSNEIDDSFDVTSLFGSSYDNEKESKNVDLSLNDDTKVDSNEIDDSFNVTNLFDSNSNINKENKSDNEISFNQANKKTNILGQKKPLLSHEKKENNNNLNNSLNSSNTLKITEAKPISFSDFSINKKKIENERTKEFQKEISQNKFFRTFVGETADYFKFKEAQQAKVIEKKPTFTSMDLLNDINKNKKSSAIIIDEESKEEIKEKVFVKNNDSSVKKEKDVFDELDDLFALYNPIEKTTKQKKEIETISRKEENSFFNDNLNDLTFEEKNDDKSSSLNKEIEENNSFFLEDSENNNDFFLGEDSEEFFEDDTVLGYDEDTPSLEDLLGSVGIISEDNLQESDELDINETENDFYEEEVSFIGMEDFSISNSSVVGNPILGTNNIKTKNTDFENSTEFIISEMDSIILDENLKEAKEVEEEIEENKENLFDLIDSQSVENIDKSLDNFEQESINYLKEKRKGLLKTSKLNLTKKKIENIGNNQEPVNKVTKPSFVAIDEYIDVDEFKEEVLDYSYLNKEFNPYLNKESKDIDSQVNKLDSENNNVFENSSKNESFEKAEQIIEMSSENIVEDIVEKPKELTEKEKEEIERQNILKNISIELKILKEDINTIEFSVIQEFANFISEYRKLRKEYILRKKMQEEQAKRLEKQKLEEETRRKEQKEQTEKEEQMLINSYHKVPTILGDISENSREKLMRLRKMAKDIPEEEETVYGTKYNSQEILLKELNEKLPMKALYDEFIDDSYEEEKPVYESPNKNTFGNQNIRPPERRGTVANRGFEKGYRKEDN